MTMTMPETATTTQPDTAESPFSGIPAGWKIAADTPDPEVTSPGKDMYILDIHPAFLPERADRVGRIEKGFYSVDEWIFLVEQGAGFYAMAALVNPPLQEHTCYYLESIKALAATGEEARLLRRVREDGSLGDLLPLGFLDEPWIRVVRDGSETSLQPETTALPFPFPVGKVPESPTLGLENSTNPELNPAPEAGATYVAWDKSWVTGNYSQILHCLADPEGALWFSDGGRFRMGSLGEPQIMSHMQSTTLRSLVRFKEEFQWIKAEPRRLAFGAGEVDSDIARQTTVIDERKETYSEALNELAEENDWCSEYEAVVQPMGFPGRGENRDYVVEVEASFEWEDDSPTSDMDSKVQDELFHGNIQTLSLSQMTMTGTATVSIAVEEVRTAPGDDVDEIVGGKITNNMVSERLQDMMGGYVTVSDYDVLSVDVS